MKQTYTKQVEEVMKGCEKKMEKEKQKKEFDKISDEGLIEMLREKNSLVRALADEAQRKTINMGFIEHHGEIRVKTAEIKLLIREIENRFIKKEVAIPPKLKNLGILVIII